MIQYYVGTVYAWRHFKWKGSFLVSPSYDFKFKSINQSECSRDCIKEAPSLKCGCGFYCFSTLANVEHLSKFNRAENILALVELSGKLIETTYGYRAQRLTFNTIFLPKFTAPLVKYRIRKNYKCKTDTHTIEELLVIDKYPNTLLKQDTIQEIPAREYISDKSMQMESP